jgi:hypothetical protein
MLALQTLTQHPDDFNFSFDRHDYNRRGRQYNLERVGRGFWCTIRNSTVSSPVLSDSLRDRSVCVAVEARASMQSTSNVIDDEDETMRKMGGAPWIDEHGDFLYLTARIRRFMDSLKAAKC